MSEYSIKVKNLTKSFTFPVKDEPRGWFKNTFSPASQTVTAVDDISFNIKKGERVAFIGPNGAGKSTTIKMLTGILQPTKGDISVFGLSPSKDRKKLAYHIGTVFGQRSQLLPNLPLTDSFELFGAMYDMTEQQTKTRTQELVELFSLQKFINQPVRKLSLGQRMRAEVALSMIHSPKIILLDEPTIGLDVVAKKSLRELLIKINLQEKTTIFLTSHDAGDIESLCERSIIINNGTIVKDAPTSELSKIYFFEKYIDLLASKNFNNFPDLPKGISYSKKDKNKITITVNTQIIDTQQALLKLLEIFNVEDINVYNASLETVIRHIYEKDSAS